MHYQVEYCSLFLSENNFVRLFNADRRQKTSVAELTDLDVILTVIEEEALNLRWLDW